MKSELYVRTEDADGDAVTLTLTSALPRGATFDTETGRFSWTPVDLSPVTIRWGGGWGRGGGGGEGRGGVHVTDRWIDDKPN